MGSAVVTKAKWKLERGSGREKVIITRKNREDGWKN